MTGIRTCIDLRERGKLLEKELGIPPDTGQFHYPALIGIGSVEGASWVVYVSVLLGWVYSQARPTAGGRIFRWLILLAIGGIVLVVKFVLFGEGRESAR